MGYRMDMGALQCRQEPRNHSQARTGTLSYAAIGVLQLGHAEPGLTTERPSGYL